MTDSLFDLPETPLSALERARRRFAAAKVADDAADTDELGYLGNELRSATEELAREEDTEIKRRTAAKEAR